MKRYFTLFAMIILLVPMADARSLWSDRSPFNSLLTDANASKVGDILTIIVQENNSANDNAESEASRTHVISTALDMIFNNRFMDKVFGGADQAPQFDWQTNNSFQGESEVDRSSQFNSRIAATVVRIDPAGNFLIEARKTLRIGKEHKTIILSGKIRPRDIINNQVFSYQVADAEISYLGDGHLTHYNNPNIIHRFLNFLF